MSNIPAQTPTAHVGTAQEPDSNSMSDMLLTRIIDATGGRMAISVPTVARLLSVSRTTAYELSRRAGFPAFSVGNRTLVSVAGLLEWVQAQTGSIGA